MNATELNKLMLEEFPELSEEFDEYTTWQDGMDTGCFITFEDLLLPLVRKAFSEHDDQFLVRACSFVERLIISGDTYERNGVPEAHVALGSALKYSCARLS